MSGDTLQRSAEHRPCKGDAYQPIPGAFRGLLAVPSCQWCVKSETQGGKCAGESVFYFMLCMVAALGDPQ